MFQSSVRASWSKSSKSSSPASIHASVSATKLGRTSIVFAALTAALALLGCAADSGPDEPSSSQGETRGPAAYAPGETPKPPSGLSMNDDSASRATSLDADPPPPRATGVVHTVTLGGGTFAPRVVTIALGDTIDFVWADGTHSVASGFRCKVDGMFQSGLHPAPFSYRLTFLKPGVFPYFSEAECEEMTGMIVVKTP